MVIKNGTDDILTRERRIVMVRFGKSHLLAMAGVLTAASVTGCSSGAIDAEATVVTVGKRKGLLGVVNFMQG